jgi:transcription-repair coupling factor (superfamily II helicase)
MKLPHKKICRTRNYVWIFVILICLIAYMNQRILAVYYEYGWYKLSSNNNDALSQIHKTISSAKEAGYSCKNKQLFGASAYREILRRKKKNTYTSHYYTTSDCVKLPTGDIILSINNGVTRYYVLLKLDENNPKSHHILEIRGEAIG